MRWFGEITVITIPGQIHADVRDSSVLRRWRTKKGGLLVANRGLYEYEILEEQDNAIAVTLLRCVAEMGDWGYFPTPKAQQLGTFCLEFEVVPYAAGETGTAFEEGYAFQQDLTVAQAGLERAFLRKPGQVKPELIEGKLPLEMSFLALKAMVFI